jgi:4-hydroxybenzoate polyprenyltransferase
VLRTIRHFLELIRFSHTLFALPFALLAAVMAWSLTKAQLWAPTAFHSVAVGKGMGEFALAKPFEWKHLVGIVFCMAFARSAAMAFNRLADRHIDAFNPRTASRHLPAGTLSVTQVIVFAATCSAAFVVSTLLFLPNRLPLWLSVPVLLFLLGYSYAKRFTSLAHFWLGAALALSPVAVWIAIRGEVVLKYPADLWPALMLGGAVLSWVAGFDIIYACQDYDADRKAELHSVPVTVGIPGALRIAAACHAFTVALLLCLPFVYPLFGWVYWTGVSAVAILLVYEHALVRPDDLSRVNAAFFNVNAVISLGLFAVGSLDLWLDFRGYWY